MIPWFVYLVPAAFVALGAVFACHVVRLRRQGQACAKWPTAPGKILASHQDVQVVENDHGRRRGD